MAELPPLPDFEELVSKHYDYVIVGGGTAGLVVANRLSEDGRFSVIVLEAGYAILQDLPAVYVPGRCGEGIGTAFDWQFETAPQASLRGRSLAWPRGKALGGSSALNFMIWNRPSRADLDAWESLGCKGWGWDAMLPFYKRSENFKAPDPATMMEHRVFYDPDAHGSGGPVTISFNKEYSAPHKYWHETLANLSVPTNEKHMSGSNVGAWTSVVAVDPITARRQYSADAYLKPVAHRENLHVITGVTVFEVILEDGPSGWTATGVHFEHRDSTYTLYASREIILSAGSVQSPHVLERSGIGNSDILQAAGIKVKVANMNVGENLQDHLMTVTVYEIDKEEYTPDDLRNDPVMAQEADEQYNTYRTGPRTLLSCSVAYIPLDRVIPPEALVMVSSRLQLSSPKEQQRAKSIPSSAERGHVEFIFDVGNWSSFMPTEEGKKYATLLQILQYPLSRGSVHIDPANANGNPIIDPQYYDADGTIDFEIQFHAAKFGQKLLETKPLADFVKKRAWPKVGINEREYRDWITENTITDWHPVGTCSIGGAEGIAAGVVDERLRVYGVRGLRVIDASVMPLQISAHLQATVYAIGEKGASMILEDAE